MMENALHSIRQEADLERRVEILESKVEDIELVLAEFLPLPGHQGPSFHGSEAS